MTRTTLRSTFARLAATAFWLAFTGAIAGCEADLASGFDDDDQTSSTDAGEPPVPSVEPTETATPTTSVTTGQQPSSEGSGGGATTTTDPEPSSSGAGGSATTDDPAPTTGDPTTPGPETDDPTTIEAGVDGGADGPVLLETTPLALAMNVDPDVVIVLEFDRPVHAGVGDFALIETINGVAIETIGAESPAISFDDDTVSVDFNATLGNSFNYALTVSSGAILDDVGMPFTGLVDSSAFNFTTAAAAPVELTSTLPELNAVDVPIDSNITLTFSTGVRAGPQGAIAVHEQGSGDEVESFLPSDPTHVTITDAVVVLDLSQNLAYDTAYYVTIDGLALQSMNGAEFAGINDDGVIAFSTELPPALLLDNSSPSDNALNVDPGTSLTLNFSEPVFVGSGSIEIHTASDDAVVQALDIADAQILNNSVTVTWSGSLENSTQYYVTAEAGIVLSELGAVYAGIDDTTTLSFATAAAPPPPFQLLSTTPATGATDVAVDANLKLTFDADVVFGSGVVTILRTDTEAVVESLAANGDRVSVSGKVVTIDPSVTLNGNTSYYVLVTPGSYESDQGGTFAGISGTTDFQFTTENSFGLVALAPAPGTTDVGPATNLVLTFTEAVEAGSGDIEIRSVNGDELYESIPSDGTRVSFAGEVVTIDLDSILVGDTEYSVSIPAGALREAASNADFAGIAAAEWTFTTSTVARPGSVNSGLMVWLDADYDASIKTGTGVRFWADRSGLRHNVKQSTSGAQPSRVGNSLNTRSVIRFDGDDDELLAADIFSLTAFEGFVVWRSSIAPQTSTQRAIVLNGSNFELDHSHHAGAPNSMVTCVGDNCADVASWFAAKFVPTPVADQAYLWDFGFDTVTTSMFTRTQGSSAVFQPAPTESPSTSDQPLAIGGNDAYCASTAGCHFLGDVAEVLLYSRTLTQAERLAVTSYLRTKWGTAAPSCNGDEVLGPNGSCYFVNTSSTTWDSARSACQGRGTGWDLATVRTQADDDFIVSLLQSDAWLGASDSAVADTWRWVTDTYHFWTGTSSGSAANGAFVHWASGEPSAGGNEGCARYRNANKAWADCACTDSYPALCEGPTN